MKQKKRKNRIAVGKASNHIIPSIDILAQDKPFSLGAMHWAWEAGKKHQAKLKSIQL